MNSIVWIGGGAGIIAGLLAYMWLQKRPREPESPPTEAPRPAPAVEAPSDPTQIAPSPMAREPGHASAQQQLYVLALNDREAGDPHFKPDPAAMQLLMTAGQEFA